MLLCGCSMTLVLLLLLDCYVADEIITSRAGVRVRVGDTDSEGRMVMADLICYMKERILKDDLKNAQVYTIATLTGHVGLSFGPGYSVSIADNILEAENRTGMFHLNAPLCSRTGFRVWKARPVKR